MSSLDLGGDLGIGQVDKLGLDVRRLFLHAKGVLVVALCLDLQLAKRVLDTSHILI